MSLLPQTLPPRLRVLASWVPVGTRFADVASDHGMLPVELLRCGHVRHAIATDLRPSPLAGARRRAARRGVLGKLELRRGDGLQPLQPGEVDVVAIAGLGGPAIARILDAGASALASVRRLVLQPFMGHERVRAWLRAHGWELIEEALCDDGGRLYASMLASPGDGEAPYVSFGARAGVAELGGPFLLARRDPRWVAAWRDELVRLEGVVGAQPDRVSVELRARCARVRALLAGMTASGES